MKSPIVNGEWTHEQGDKYLVVGIDKAGQRYRTESEIWRYIEGINIYRGNKYLIRNGRRYLIQRINN